MTTLAKSFGISDVGLRKICVKHSIPTPPPGYWAKLQHGKKVEKLALPTPKPGLQDRIIISIYAPQKLPDIVVTARQDAEKRLPTPIEVPDDLPARLHRLASTTRTALRSAKTDYEGFLEPEPASGVIFAQIGKSNVTRVTLILNSIAHTLEKLGNEVVYAENGADFLVEGEKLRLLFHETKTKNEHHPTAAELAEKARWDNNSKQWPTLYRSDRKHWRSWDYSPSGRLSLTLQASSWTSWSSDRQLGRWYDRKSTTVEQQINEVIIAMYAGSALLRHNRAVIEEREKQRQEAAERRQKERERQDRILKRESFVRQKSKEYMELRELQAFSEYFSQQSHSGLTYSSAIAALATEMTERLRSSFLPSNINDEVVELALFTDDDFLLEAIR
ncbi:MAG: hypothetical protein CFE29_17945 [Bradyrhizobiaceae bacterium PARB1]|nr:MAG: hypothetical protein CFE29_17945 [Bradyrhizobiaceae bacterium PARB1]